jgi:ribokinase
MMPRVHVFGPVYLDRVLRVDGPLRSSGPIDRSVKGRIERADEGGLEIVAEVGRLLIDPLPGSWPGPRGRVILDGNGLELDGETKRRGVYWRDDLGGMGAGYAATLKGTLYFYLGDPWYWVSQQVMGLFKHYRLQGGPTYRHELSSDWTLLISSGPHGDKLPIGFRSILQDSPLWDDIPGYVDVLVVAGLTNRLARAALRTPATIRVLAPTMSNMLDHELSFEEFAGSANMICCNREEWSACAGRDQIAEKVDVLVLTDGPRGSSVRFRTPASGHDEVVVPAFPRAKPPSDTNRAGEAYASTFIQALWEAGWRTGPLMEVVVRRAASRAAAAAAIVLDYNGFGFPSAGRIDDVLRAGIIT